MSKAITIDETKLNLETICIEQNDDSTIFLTFDNLFEVDEKYYTEKEFDALNLDTRDEFVFTPAAEFWIDANRWVYFLLFDADIVDWDISNDMQLFIKKQIAEYLCDYNRTGCSDCEFNRATEYNCPLGRKEE